jgi:hypothetical protein
MTAVPVRIPNEWSPDWFRRLYAEVLSRPTVEAFKPGMLYMAANDTPPATVLGYGEWAQYGTGVFYMNDGTALAVYVWQRSA